MKSPMLLAFFFILLCVQFLSNLALESQEEKGTPSLSENGYNGDDGLKRDQLMLSKASKGKGTYGGQNDRPPSTKKSRAVSILSKPPVYISNTGIGGVVVSMILVFGL
ncbi:unnamed protein product [Lactuca virosa]|uniref:Transmembrane protein n=1 Tax=Lactuca virosa TaxID=75947 RepID=A0AAU9LW45_9ASTR|nr:unnamed protein product [Lactuca virosa]